MHFLPIARRAAAAFSLAPCVLIFLMLATVLTPTPAATQALGPTTNAFDGTYVGVSRELTLGKSARATQCDQPGIPEPLTISNGVVRSTEGGGSEGSVNPQGVAVIRRSRGMRLNAQVDAQGT